MKIWVNFQAFKNSYFQERSGKHEKNLTKMYFKISLIYNLGLTKMFNKYMCIMMYQQVHHQIVSLLYIHNTFKRAPRDNMNMYLRESQKLTSVSSFVPLFESNQICRQEDVKMLLCKFLFFYLYFNIINLHFDLEFDKISSR